MKWKLMQLVMILILTSVITGCGSKKTTEQTKRFLDEAPPEVAELYKSSCLSCHGTDLQGVVGPKLSGIGSVKSKEQIAHIVSEGKGRMVSLKSRLNPDEIDKIAEWLAGLK